jgi:dihydropyrimidinase
MQIIPFYGCHLLLVTSGGIDPHTHLAMGTETIDDFFSGQAAALAGGTTMHIDFVIPVNGSLIAGLESYEEKAKKSCMDYGFHMAITKFDDSVSRDMEIMVKEKGWYFCSRSSMDSF